jgi:LmbE family N-acetylglucosaminyl deacetylase
MVFGGESLKVLAIGAHPDDAEIGCGASLKLFKDMGHEVYVLVLTKGEASGDPIIREKQCELAGKELDVDKVYFGNLEDTKISDGIETIIEIEKVVEVVQPDVIFTHGYKDQHQDHRNASMATLSAARNVNKILLYESPAAFRDFCPQVFIDAYLTFNAKLQALEAYGATMKKVYFRGNHENTMPDEARHFPHIANAVEGLARYRGFQAGLTLAEAFEVGKFVWAILPAQNQQGSGKLF